MSPLILPTPEPQGSSDIDFESMASGPSDSRKEEIRSQRKKPIASPDCATILVSSKSEVDTSLFDLHGKVQEIILYKQHVDVGA